MGIESDSKDWTWVLEKPCPECGFDAGSFPREAVVDLIRANAASWPAVLERPDVTHRPAAMWSALEYACHVRDVYRIYGYRLGLMLDEDDPHYPNWDQDETAVAERYNDQHPATVARELPAAATALADRFDAVTGEQWNRTGNRSDGKRFTVESFARYMIHDPVHHLWDVRPK